MVAIVARLDRGPGGLLVVAAGVQRGGVGGGWHGSRKKVLVGVSQEGDGLTVLCNKKPRRQLRLLNDPLAWQERSLDDT
jgi:hypothetical protein